MSKIVFGDGSNEPKITQVLNKNGNNSYLGFWQGTLEQYVAISSSDIDPNVLYFIKEEDDTE